MCELRKAIGLRSTCTRDAEHGDEHLRLVECRADGSVHPGRAWTDSSTGVAMPKAALRRPSARVVGPSWGHVLSLATGGFSATKTLRPAVAVLERPPKVFSALLLALPPSCQQSNRSGQPMCASGWWESQRTRCRGGVLIRAMNGGVAAKRCSATGASYPLGMTSMCESPYHWLRRAAMCFVLLARPNHHHHHRGPTCESEKVWPT